MRILGLHSSGHDTAIAILDNGRLSYANETERITRLKHDGNVQALLSHLQNYEGNLLRGVDLIAFSTNVNQKIAMIRNGVTLAQAIGKTALHQVGTSAMLGRECPCVVVAHEAAHAMTAVHQAGYPEKMLAFVNEGNGSFSRNSLFLYKDRRLTLAESDRLPWYGTGFGWTAMGIVLGMGKSPSLAGTVMALSAYGNENEALAEMLRSVPDDICYRSRDRQNLEVEKFTNYLRDHGRQATFELIFEFQRRFENAIVSYIAKINKIYPSYKLGLAGGCALNIYSNTKLRDTLNQEIYIPPNCNDSGQAHGAALYAHHLYCSQPATPTSVYQCGAYMDSLDAQNASKRWGWTLSAAEPHRVAKILEQGHVLAICRGKGEMGPRALGSRSLLASSSIPGMRHRVSEELKGRHWFRPLGSVMREESFHQRLKGQRLSPLMLFNYDASTLNIPEAKHADQSSRIQTVSISDNQFLWELLLEYEQHTGESALINTSLNGKDRAIANSVENVFEDFHKSELSHVVCGDLLLSRSA